MMKNCMFRRAGVAFGLILIWVCAQAQPLTCWKMERADKVTAPASELCSPQFDASAWMKAVVPGTVLTSLVENGVYPDPYYGVTNKLSENKIPDITEVGPAFYTYWFRTEFDRPPLADGERLWLHPEGINYRAEWWLNGHLVSVMAGMFNDDCIDITDFVKEDGPNALAVLVKPVDVPGTTMPKPWGAPGENRQLRSKPTPEQIARQNHQNKVRKIWQLIRTFFSMINHL